MATEAVSAESIDREVRGQTVVSRFLATVAAHPDHSALKWKHREVEGWGQLAFAGYAFAVARAMVGLRQFGLGRGDRVLLLLRNSPEFHIADMATMMCGAVPISVLHSSSPEQVRYVAAHSRARVAVVEDTEILQRLLALRSGLPDLESVVVVDDPDGDAPGEVSRWEDVLDNERGDLQSAAAQVRPDDLATVIYTSGTTGPPKGVQLTHRNVVWTCESYMHLLDIDPLGFRAVAYLPMAHVAERMATHYLGAVNGYQVTTCPDPDLLVMYLHEARPNFFFGVPRIWEKLQGAAIAAFADDPQKARKFEDALAAARPLVLARLERELTRSERHTLATLDRRVFRPVRDLLGLDAVELAVVGAAPVGVEVLEWFLTIGVPLSETYGMSETAAGLTWEPYRIRPGTVGRPLPGVSVRLAEDGEILAKGGNVFPGYLDDPDLTGETLDEDGWLHTGDVGEFDDDGYLRIVDRKRELIVSAGGENISPANLEAALQGLPLVAHACAVGDRRPFMAALVVLDPDVAPAWAKERGIAFSSLAELADDPAVRREIEEGADVVMAEFSPYERVKKTFVLAEEWDLDSDELTATAKLRRRAVLEKYASVVDDLYR